MVDQLTAPAPEGAAKWRAPQSGVRRLAVFSQAVVEHPKTGEHLLVRVTQVPRESGGLRTARVTASPLSSEERSVEGALASVGASSSVETGFSPISPESFHRTPEIDIFTPERPGVANGVNK